MSFTNIEYYALPKCSSDNDYWDHLYELTPSSRTPEEGLNVVATMSTWPGSSDFGKSVYYLTDIELEQFLTIQYLYWNGIRVFPDGSIKQVYKYAKGGEEVVYYGKFVGGTGHFKNGNKQIYDAHQQIIEDEKKAKEAEKQAAKEAKKAKKIAKEKERLKTLWEKAKKEGWEIESS